ncbi:hypothetical protein [Pseudoroseomonas cervicalis]|uniref:hypothetical protein n=1 Tax=Teichococcus cervicalis TaxID=204525 RepID=UPI002786B24D|nr:hypothetical protein [Pseudoroseomonas cervicalis]MDQ1081494.1 hypothetical protein [Pseudoroseomonas cervicalis]
MPSPLLAALLAAQALAAGPAPLRVAAPEGDRLLPLLPATAGQPGGCTRDGRWCVTLSEPDEAGEVRPVLQQAGPGAAGEAAPPAPEAESGFGEPSYTPWPALILLAEGGALAGVQREERSAYSGGGGSGSTLLLFHIPAGGSAGPKPVLEVPLRGALLIRACFDERDQRRRRGACHDEYGFSATLSLAPGRSEGRPALRYSSEAWAFPRGVSREADSTAMRPLRQADLVRERDARCSVTRQFRYEAASGAYRPDTPLPDCSAYTVP